MASYKQTREFNEQAYSGETYWGIRWARLQRYNGAWSGDLANNTAFDYFDDSPSVDDAIYFGNNGGRFHSLTFYVGTVIIATDLVLVWEYWDGSAWTALSNVVDNTNGFTTTGENTVSWDLPDDMSCGLNVINTDEGWAVRCRIDSFTSVSEGGAQSTQKMKLTDDFLEITGTGNTPTTLLAEDVSNSWGVITQNDFGYKIRCDVNNEGTLTIKDEEMLQVGDADKNCLFTQNNLSGLSILTLGELNANGFGQNGGTLKIYNAVNTNYQQYFFIYGNLNCYGSKIIWNYMSHKFSLNSVGDIRDSQFNWMTACSGMTSNITGTWVRSSIGGMSYAFYFFGTVDNLDNLKMVDGIITSALDTFWLLGGTALKNCDLTNITDVLQIHSSSGPEIRNCTNLDEDVVSAAKENPSSNLVQTVEVEAIITDEDGNPLENVLMTAEDNSGKNVLLQCLNDRGSITLDNLQDTTDTSGTLSNESAWSGFLSVNDYILERGEVMKIASISGTTVGVVRNQTGTEKQCDHTSRSGTVMKYLSDGILSDSNGQYYWDTDKKFLLLTKMWYTNGSTTVIVTYPNINLKFQKSGYEAVTLPITGALSAQDLKASLKMARIQTDQEEAISI